MQKVKAYHKTMKKLFIGTLKRQNREMQKHKIIWVYVMQLARA